MYLKTDKDDKDVKEHADASPPKDKSSLATDTKGKQVLDKPSAPTAPMPGGTATSKPPNALSLGLGYASSDEDE